MRNEYSFNLKHEEDVPQGGKRKLFDVSHGDEKVGEAYASITKNGNLAASHVDMTHPAHMQHAYNAHEQLKQKVDPKLAYRHFKEQHVIDVKKHEMLKFNNHGQWKIEKENKRSIDGNVVNENFGPPNDKDGVDA